MTCIRKIKAEELRLQPYIVYTYLGANSTEHCETEYAGLLQGNYRL